MEPVVAGLGSRIHIHDMYIISDPISSQKRRKTWLNDRTTKMKKKSKRDSTQLQLSGSVRLRGVGSFPGEKEDARSSAHFYALHLC